MGHGGLQSRVYKAQWPIATNGQPMIVVYPDATREPWYYFPATPQYRKRLFRDKWIKVYFRGWVRDNNLEVLEFVRRDEWM